MSHGLPWSRDEVLVTHTYGFVSFSHLQSLSCHLFSFLLRTLNRASVIQQLERSFLENAYMFSEAFCTSNDFVLNQNIVKNKQIVCHSI